jgi:hypothetical protein
MPTLEPTQTEGAEVTPTGVRAWRLQIPAGPQGRYRLAQLDDYTNLARGDFPWRPPVELSLRARASAPEIAGTWGIGLWNDPFSLSLGLGGATRRVPSLPNAAWFFMASPPNYLSLRDDLPAQGSLAATFRAPRLPAALLALGAPFLPLALLPPAYRLLRRAGRRILRQAAADFADDLTGWHAYRLRWSAARAEFSVDGHPVLRTATVPVGPLGLVIWVDNQYAALPPDGRVRFGTLSTPEPAWIEVEDLVVEGA